MPEGDTVYRTAAKLREALEGRELTRCDVRVPRYATVDLSGQTVDEVLSRGKHLFIRVGQASIHSHLLMDGAWVIGRVRVPSYKIRIVLETARSRASGVDLGVLEILDRATDMEAVAHLGPDLLGPDWSAPVAAANLVADPSRPVAEALLDQRVMAGVGNVYANELCFVFGLRPGTAVGELADPVRGREPSAADVVAQQVTGEPHHHRKHPPRPGRVGVRPGRAAVPSLWHPDRNGQGRRPGHLLVPHLPTLNPNPRRNCIPAAKVRVEPCANAISAGACGQLVRAALIRRSRCRSSRHGKHHHRDRSGGHGRRHPSRTPTLVSADLSQRPRPEGPGADTAGSR